MKTDFYCSILKRKCFYIIQFSFACVDVLIQPYYKIILGFVLIVNLKLLISYKKKKKHSYRLQAASYKKRM